MRQGRSAVLSGLKYRIVVVGFVLFTCGFCGGESDGEREASWRDAGRETSGAGGGASSPGDGAGDEVDASDEPPLLDSGLDASGSDEPRDGGELDGRDATADGAVEAEDVDSCETGPCFPGVECIDLAPPDEGYACGPCPDGYEGDGESCSDIRECETDNGGCDAEQTCIEVIGGPPECSDLPTTTCLLTYRLEMGNGGDSSGYTDSNMRIRDTTLSAGDGTWAVGPGSLVIRVPSDGGQNPAAGQAEILYYHLIIEFSTTTLGTTVDTDVDAACPGIGADDNEDPVASGQLSMGAVPEITWDSCELPAGYDGDRNAYTPDVAATGNGCLKPYRSTGNVACSGGGCGLGNLVAGDNPQDETWEQRLEPLIFSDDMTSFSMPMMQLPNRTPSRTYLSWGGTRTSISCTP